jgi:SH3 domain protein
MISLRAGDSLGPGRLSRGLVCALALGCIGLAAEPARGATAWVKGEVRLNVRTGPSNEYRILGELHTGDKVDVLENGTGWTRIRSGDREGWVPEGYLQDEPPPAVLLADAQAKATQLAARVETLEAEAAKLGDENRSFGERDTSQRSELETLTRENLELKAGAAWPERIVGAAILGAGMLIGWLIHVISSRRQRPPRIRL